MTDPERGRLRLQARAPLETAVILLLFASAAALAVPSPSSTGEPDQPVPLSQVVVTAPSAQIDTPASSASITRETLDRTVNTVTVEDALRYLPNVLIRQRHFGDTQDPISTRTSGVGASARSLIYADGVLLSSLFGNNNSSASPHWGLVSPSEIERVDVLYGPFSAAYPGNSIGSVVEITTRTPQHFELTAEAQGALQSFEKYGDHETLGTSRFAATLGDRFDRFSIFASYNHLDSESQPLAYATVGRPAATSTAGAPVAGGFLDASRTGAPILVLGSSGNERQKQDNLSLKLAYDLTPSLTATYRLGLFHNDDAASPHSFLTDAGGAAAYAGSLNVLGRSASVPASAFDANVYRFEEDLLAQGLTLASRTGGPFDYELTGSRFDYLQSRQRLPTAALPSAFTGGPGTLVSLDCTGWWTFDAKGTWRVAPAHTVSFGLHQDRYDLVNPRYALADWRNGSPGATTALTRGRTQTFGAWAQDVWMITPILTATLGARYEHFEASNGLNFSAFPALSVTQPRLEHDDVSPKATLAATPWAGWTFKASAGMATRYPTVTELYQAITTGSTLTSPNPNLKPEQALSGELSAERTWSRGKLRLSLFSERIKDALLSQSAPLLPGSSTLFSYVQNVDRVVSHGVELVGQQDDVVVKGLSLSGWVTYVDSAIDKDAAFPAAVGKQAPQLPRLRASLVATWSPTSRFDLTLAARYSDRSFATLDNSDPYANTYQGFGSFFVVDAKARYKLTPRLTAELGADNLTNQAYFLFHPFPQRTVILSLRYAY